MVHGFVGRAFLDVLKSSTAAPPRYEREKDVRQGEVNRELLGLVYIFGPVL